MLQLGVMASILAISSGGIFVIVRCPKEVRRALFSKKTRGGMIFLLLTLVLTWGGLAAQTLWWLGWTRIEVVGMPPILVATQSYLLAIVLRGTYLWRKVEKPDSAFNNPAQCRQ